MKLPSSSSDYTSSGWRIIFRSQSSDHHEGPHLVSRDDEWQFFYARNGSKGGWWRTGDIVSWQDGNWHHYTLTWDGPGAVAAGEASAGPYLKFYRDGSEFSWSSYTDAGTWLDSDSYDTDNTAKHASFGSDFAHGSNKSQIASYDEIAIWKTDLSSSQITTIYNSGTPADVSTIEASDLKRYYRFEASDGTDTAGNYTGSIGSASTIEDY